MVGTIADPAFLARVRKAGARFEQGLLRFGAVRGRGLLLAVDLGRPIGSKVVEQARKRGLLINSPRPQVLRFMPALTISDSEIDTALELLASAIDACDH